MCLTLWNMMWSWILVGLKRCLFSGRPWLASHWNRDMSCKILLWENRTKYNVSCTESISGMGRGSEPYYDNVFLAMKHADVQPNYLNAMTDHVHGTQNELITFTSHEWVHSPMGFWHDIVAIGSLLSRFCQTCFISPLPLEAITCDNTSWWPLFSRPQKCWFCDFKVFQSSAKAETAHGPWCTWNFAQVGLPESPEGCASRIWQAQALSVFRRW